MDTTRSTSKPVDMSQAISILEGETFLVSDVFGDVPQEGAYGLFHRDTRFLSRFLLRLNDNPLDLITSRQQDYFSAGIFLCNLKEAHFGERTISVIRKRLIEKCLHEEIIVENHNDFEINVKLSLELDSDFADLFEVKSQLMMPKRRVLRTADGDRHITLSYQRGQFYRAAGIYFSQPAQLIGNEVVFNLTLPPKAIWDLLMRIDLMTELATERGTVEAGRFDLSENETSKALQRWEETIPTLYSDDDRLNHSYKRACIDLAALRIHAVGITDGEPLPAAGLPWFMTLFGRDTLIASYQAIILGTALGERAVVALARQQGDKVDDFRDEQPGKILHEVRHGELATFGEEPHSPYFGSVDATMLFLILISEIYRWTGNTAIITQMRQAIVNAIFWMEKYGGLLERGYVYYHTKSPRGLRNQGWKDSADAVQFFDGRLAEPPIALCEVQGYAYDAYARASQMFAAIGESDPAKALEVRALDLRKRFNNDFWMPNEERYALGLDKDGRHIDSICSNMGHLLWSGVVEASRAPQVVAQLMDEQLFSGWGIRTMSRQCRGFNPIGYHIGTVWPHDNSIIASGLKRYGYANEAATVIEGMLCAAAAFEHRLPEAFAGYRRGRLSFPARYPTGCSPQAWASGAPLLFLRTLLGLEPDVANRRLTCNSHLPDTIGNITLSGVPAYGKLYRVSAQKGRCLIEEIRKPSS